MGFPLEDPLAHWSEPSTTREYEDLKHRCSRLVWAAPASGSPGGFGKLEQVQKQQQLMHRCWVFFFSLNTAENCQKQPVRLKALAAR